MATPRYLTKSRFKLAVECPTKLYYTGKRHEYYDSMSDNDFLAMLAEGGYQVGELAKYRFPDGIEINDKNHITAEVNTLELLKRDSVILFEPAIRVGSFFIRIDILVKRGNRFELIEVKAKSYDSSNPQIEGARGGIKSGMLPYLQDAAFQTWVLQQAFPKAEITTSLIMPDKAQASAISGLNQIFKISKHDGRTAIKVQIPENVDMKTLADTLLARVSVDKYVQQIVSTPLAYGGGEASLPDAALMWADAYQKDQRIIPVLGAHCGTCQFKTGASNSLRSGFHECWKQANNWSDTDFETGTVLDLWGFRKKQKLIEQGIYKINQVVREDIGDFDDTPDESGLSHMQRQWLQVDGIPPDYDYGGFYFDRSLMLVEMSQWKFPYHLIDFETSATALPFHVGMRPYEPVAFQFSHHVLERDGTVRHVGEFLSVEPGVFPNYDFARALKKELEADDGSVFMWSHHENTILSKIVEQLSKDPNPPSDAAELIEFMRTLIKGGSREMIDLRDIAKKSYFHPDTKGSNSIKKVLPAILKTSQNLRDTYSRPIYGAPNGIPSLNYSSQEGFTWLRIDAQGNVDDPYSLLKEYAKDLIPDDIVDTPETRASIIAEGGAATTAYARLQFEGMDEKARHLIKTALLRYCELDTLAMVMVLQGWTSLVSADE